jgi:hypothetical protein
MFTFILLQAVAAYVQSKAPVRKSEAVVKKLLWIKGDKYHMKATEVVF